MGKTVRAVLKARSCTRCSCVYPVSFSSMWPQTDGRDNRLQRILRKRWIAKAGHIPQIEEPTRLAEALANALTDNCAGTEK